MKNLIFLICVILSMLTISCKKNSSDGPAPAVTADYFQLKTGNYWIYEGFKIDTNGLVSSTGVYDSAHIQKDTIIGGKTYYELWEKAYVIGDMQFPVYLRDSSGYLVTKDGITLASDCNFTDTIELDNTYPKVYLGYVKMTGKDSLVSDALGNLYTSITASKRIVPTPPDFGYLPVRYLYDVYGKGVGKIKSHTFFFSGIGPHYEARLVRYKVN
jgi:hypothetical protein